MIKSGLRIRVGQVFEACDGSGKRIRVVEAPLTNPNPLPVVKVVDAETGCEPTWVDGLRLYSSPYVSSPSKMHRRRAGWFLVQDVFDPGEDGGRLWMS